MRQPLNYRTRILSSLSDVGAAAWDGLLASQADANPFLRFAFLDALHASGSAAADAGWQPQFLTVWQQDTLVAAMPLYAKGHSYGEYVFDWAWANAYAQHGLDYYPKLLCAVPYSPVTGPRLLAGSGEDASALRNALIDAMQTETERRGWSSAHLNFATEADAVALADGNWLARFDWQFHWHNVAGEHGGWRDFADFLDALTPKKRKNIRQERERVARAGVRCEIRHGDELDVPLWRAVHKFYLSTFAEKGNYPLLTLPFFRHLGHTLGQRVLVVLAWREHELIAAALLLRSRDTLYGRYWGCREQVPGLHFEACYYQGIDYCLRHGLSHFEPGAQGEHKLARGFLPTLTRSFHYLADTRFRAAVRDALAREADALRAYRDELMAHSPYAQSP